LIAFGGDFMSKEVLRPSQFRAATFIPEDQALQLSEAQKQDLAALYEGTLSTFKPESIIEGTVLNVGPDGVLVDIHYKSDGLIPLYEFNEQELKKLKPGSTIKVVIDELENLQGTVTLSYEKAKAAGAWDAIMKLYEAGKPVEGVVTHKVKGGLNVDIGIPAFLPGSQVDVQRVGDFDQFVGQTINAYVIKINQKRGNVIISRRKFLNEQRSESRKQILDAISEGQVIQGTIKNITNYGVFVDIGGVDGLLHITDMTWGRISHPSEIVKIGDVITVKVLSFDKVNEKISLGMKQLSENPWEALPESVQVGTMVKGKISSITDYGLFVEVAKGVEGLIHISEISWTDRINDLQKHYKVGQEIEAMVVSLDKENRRMSLSIKQLSKNPWDEIAEKFAIGQKITGKITNITDFGVFVQLIPGVDGLVHISDLSWTEHIKHPSDLFKKGDEVTAVITDINKDKKKISLSIKQLEENPWENLEQKYPIGSTVEGEISKITDFGAFVKLASGIEGLVHISEISAEQVAKIEDIVKVGEKREFRVIKVNQEEHKLGLSLKPEGSSAAPRKAKTTAKSEKTEKPRRERPERETSTRSASKVKSQLQLELEKYASDSASQASSEMEEEQ
jgi:small subunit ribosomal protein S1